MSPLLVPGVIVQNAYFFHGNHAILDHFVKERQQAQRFTQGINEKLRLSLWYLYVSLCNPLPDVSSLRLRWDANHIGFIQAVDIAEAIELFEIVHRRTALDGDCGQGIRLAHDVGLVAGAAVLIGDRQFDDGARHDVCGIHAEAGHQGDGRIVLVADGIEGIAGLHLVVDKLDAELW